ncbi:unnamed protein product [Amoebophrya sp. A25]|nr:unnamed protein product [Amoebophrya sp. A25]|eukprot:GSA25T00007465001.1
MARPIQKLDDEVINRIAAGEVVVRPCNALKELLENSIDAGSKRVNITIRGNKMEDFQLQIEDDGCGIRKADLGILCERFTTSKLAKYEDLTTISTFGFRGEALSSISHVARVTITTRTKEAKLATRAMYKDCGALDQTKDIAPTGLLSGQSGTIVEFKDLFWNNLGRRKVLHNLGEEYRKILEVVQCYACHYPGVALSCRREARAPDVRTSGSLFCTKRDAVSGIYGKELGNRLVGISFEDEALHELKVDALCTDLNHTCKKQQVVLFVNNRLVENAKVQKAVHDAYAGLVGKTSHGFVYVDLRLDPAAVDVNVHPTKADVHLMDCFEICKAFTQELRDALDGGRDTRRVDQLHMPIAKRVKKEAVLVNGNDVDGEATGLDANDNTGEDEDREHGKTSRKQNVLGGSTASAGARQLGGGSTAVGGSSSSDADPKAVTRVRTNTRQPSVRDFWDQSCSHHLGRLLKEVFNEKFVRRLREDWRRTKAAEEEAKNETRTGGESREVDPVAVEETSTSIRKTLGSSMSPNPVKLKSLGSSMSPNPWKLQSSPKTRFSGILRRFYLELPSSEVWTRRVQQSVWIGVVDSEKCMIQSSNKCLLVNMRVIAELASFQLLLLCAHARLSVPTVCLLEEGSNSRSALESSKQNNAAIRVRELLGSCLAQTRNRNPGGARKTAFEEPDQGLDEGASTPPNFLDAEEFPKHFSHQNSAEDEASISAVVRILGKHADFLGGFCGIRLVPEENSQNKVESNDDLLLTALPNLFCFRSIDSAVLLSKLPALLLDLAALLHVLDAEIAKSDRDGISDSTLYSTTTTTTSTREDLEASVFRRVACFMANGVVPALPPNAKSSTSKNGASSSGTLLAAKNATNSSSSNSNAAKRTEIENEADQKRRKATGEKAYVLLHEQWRTVHLAPWFKAPLLWDTDQKARPLYEVVALEQLYRVFERC